MLLSVDWEGSLKEGGMKLSWSVLRNASVQSNKVSYTVNLQRCTNYWGFVMSIYARMVPNEESEQICKVSVEAYFIIYPGIFLERLSKTC